MIQIKTKYFKTKTFLTMLCRIKNTLVLILKLNGEQTRFLNSFLWHTACMSRMTKGLTVRSCLYPGHCDSGRSRSGHVAVGRASLHQVPGVGHEHATVGSKHEVLSQGIHQHDDHPFEQRFGESSRVGSPTCKVEARRQKCFVLVFLFCFFTWFV